MSKIIVTGGAGFIGSHLVKQLCTAGHDVYVLDAFYHYINPPISGLFLYNVNYRFENLIKTAKIFRGNIQNKDELRRIVTSIDPDIIVHFAALPLANIAIEYSEEAFGTIVGGTVNLLEILRDHNRTKFVYISSSMVYGDFEKVPVPEDARKEPKEIYGGMKLAGEYMVKSYAQRYGMPYSIVRPSAVYGPTDNNRRVVGLFLSNAIQKKKIKVTNGESTFLDFSYVEDVAEGIGLVALSSKSNNEAFNITRGQGHNLLELTEVIKELYPDTTFDYVQEESFRPNRGTLDTSKAAGLLGFSPKVGLKEGVKRYAKFLEEAHKSVH
jgi:nucleoside-diphosphate-sugar epimerase